jgi:hypothetical protein
MKRMRVVIGVGLVGFAGLTTSCTEDKELRNYLGKAGKMVEWETKVSKAVCNLENKTGTTSGDIYCGTAPWPPSSTPPPAYPPK